MPEINDDAWFKIVEELHIDRISLLTIVGCIELAVRHPEYTGPSKSIAIGIGHNLATRLIQSGLKAPYYAAEAWKKTFNL